jgi:hypothetical protein
MALANEAKPEVGSIPKENVNFIKVGSICTALLLFVRYSKKNMGRYTQKPLVFRFVTIAWETST